jgi:acyl-CoA oxidase
MDKQELSELILGDDPSKVNKWFELFKDPVWVPKYNMNWKETRDEPMKKLLAVSRSKLLSVKDFFKDPKNVFLAHEFIAQVDGSTVIKLTVQFNLFGGSMVALHTDRHTKYFD